MVNPQKPSIPHPSIIGIHIIPLSGYWEKLAWDSPPGYYPGATLWGSVLYNLTTQILYN